jgi:CelD/BcsL family acetyltransferase involved in cellulose biosynthesis
VKVGSTGQRGFESVRWAWQQLDVHAQYYFQDLVWMDSVAELCDQSVLWDIVMESDQPAAVVVVRRFRPRRAGLALRVVSEVRIGDMGYPFVDCLLGAETDNASTVDVDDLLSVGGDWDILNVKARRIGSPWVALAATKGWVEEEPGGGVGILNTRSSPQEWWGNLPKNMRDSVRKARTRIASSGGSELVVSTGGDLPEAFEQFLALEASGWKGSQGGALLRRPVWRDVLGDYLRGTERAQIRSLVIAGRPVASQICVTIGNTLVLMKVAYDEELGRLSPGNVLMANLVEACCEDPAIDRIDCTVWLDWHQRWGMVREPTYRILAFNRRSLRGRAAKAAWHARRRLKRNTG